MIKGYNFHLQGKRHKRDGNVCQDYSILHEIAPSLKIVAVADGVSTRGKSCSEVASKLACETVCKTIEDSLPYDPSEMCLVEKDVEAVILSAMHAAANAVDKYVEIHNEDYAKYDTTLVVALYNGDSVYMGMIGDSGIVLLLDNGDLLFTAPMNDEYGHVYPLRCRSLYRTSTNKGVAAVFCTTDGLFKDHFVNFGNIDKGRADRFIPYKLFSNAIEDADAYLEQFKAECIRFCEEEKSLADDISVSLLMNPDKCVFKTKKESIDYVTSVKAVVSFYQDENIRKKAFLKNVQVDYPEFTDEDCLAIYNGEAEFKDILAKYKGSEDKPVEGEVHKTATDPETHESESEDVHKPEESETVETETEIPAEESTDHEKTDDEFVGNTDASPETDPEETQSTADAADKEESKADEIDEGNHVSVPNPEINDEHEDETDCDDEEDKMIFNIFKRKKHRK